MTHRERFARRRIFAQLVSSGQSSRQVADRFGVSQRTIAEACFEFGVDISKRRRGPSMGIYAVSGGAS